MKTFIQWLETRVFPNDEKIRSSRQWRNHLTRERSFDDFLKLPQKKEIFKDLSTSPLPSSILGNFDKIYKDIFVKYPDLVKYVSGYEIENVHREAIKFNGDFDAFVKAASDPLFVPQYDSPIGHDIFYDPRDRDASEIARKIPNLDQIPNKFFHIALHYLNMKYRWDQDKEGKIIQFFSQPLKQQFQQIRKIEREFRGQYKDFKPTSFY